MTSPSTPTTPGQPANQYASRVPTMIQQPPSTQQPHSREDSTRPTIPGLPLQRLPMGALASKVVGPGQPSPGAQSGTNGAAMQRGLIDSMNLKQPPPITPAPKQKQQQFTFRYDDTDTLMAELQEFFPYVEMDFMLRGQKHQFERDFKESWTESSVKTRQAHLLTLLHSLESSSPSIRLQSASHLLYLLQGAYGDPSISSEEEQLHWAQENARMLRGLDGVSLAVGCLMDVVRRHDAIATDTSHVKSDEEALELASEIDDLNHETGVYLGILYFLVEICRADEEFGEELMALDPPLPVYLLRTVAGLREKNTRGFPVKKLLLLLWKTLLACLGGLNDARRAVDLQRDLSGLPPVRRRFTRVTPTGIKNFRSDLSTKYPTFIAPMTPEALQREKLAQAIEPIPIRSNYHSSVEEGLPPAFVSRAAARQAAALPLQPAQAQQAGAQQQVQAGGPGNPQSLPQAGTPAPSPPPSPQVKPKKQQYQTDQTRPFVFPFTRSQGGSTSRLVPRAIDEADQLYEKHVYIPLSLHQLCKTRDEYIREEAGLGFGLGSLSTGLMGIERSRDVYEDEEGFDGMGEGEADDEAWTAWKVDDWKLEERQIEREIAEDMAGVRDIMQKRKSLKRLYRVEVIYRSMLPYAQSIVVVLLKLLLATVTGNSVNPNPPGGPGSPTEEKPITAIEQPVEKQMSLEEVDVARHREITSKAVSAILLLLLKWFKSSHVLKFQHLSTLLIDSNCLLLVLKMFGLQELLTLIQSKHEKEDDNLFRSCHLQFHRNRTPNNKNSDSPAQRPATTTTTTIDGEEVELLNDYSWRNFFYVINFMKIMHQLTKGRPTRINLLVQYKSSQILKRMLRVPHPMLQLSILKVIKSQIPFLGRKWRHSNMKTITSIYLNCQPELRDEWLALADAEQELEESSAVESTLRTLVRFYHNKHYASVLGHIGMESISAAHRRSDSLAAGGPAEVTSASSFRERSDSDVFPPNKTLLERPPQNNEQDYNPDTIMGAWMYDYEAVIESVLGADSAQEAVRDAFATYPPVPHSPGRQQDFGFGFGNAASNENKGAWSRLEEIIGARSGQHDDAISDSESVVSIGELGPDARLAFDDQDDVEEDPVKARQRRKSTGNENTWEHISPEMSMLPKSPGEHPRRRSSSSNSSPLRPVIPSGTDWLLDQPFEVEDDEEPGPMPIQEGTEDELARDHMPADEVEAFYQV